MRKTISPIADRAKHVRMNVDVQPPVFQEALPLVRARRRKDRKTATEMNPAKSNDRIRSDRYSRWIRTVAAMPMMPTGTLTSKIVCQAKWSTRYPPIIGPKETEAAEAMAQKPRARPRSSIGNSRVTMAIPTGIRKPAPAPWTTRKKIRLLRSQDREQSRDPKVNRVSASR